MKARLLVLSVIAWIGWAAVYPEQASAQLRICGPGETPVGWDNTPIPPVPLCPGGPPTSAPAAPSAPLVDYANIAWHPDYDDV